MIVSNEQPKISKGSLNLKAFEAMALDVLKSEGALKLIKAKQPVIMHLNANNVANKYGEAYEFQTLLGSKSKAIWSLSQKVKKFGVVADIRCTYTNKQNPDESRIVHVYLKY